MGEKDDVRKNVRDRYAGVANAGQGCGCTPPEAKGCCGDAPSMPVIQAIKLGYTEAELKKVPEGANMGLGCGNPNAIAGLSEGETVLDLGAGGGFDCFLAAEKVGEHGHVIGVDMTPDMLAKARANSEKDGFTNVEFRLGEIEHVPAADSSVDVVISNCVINLSPEKDQVYREIFRVLRPGGRVAISDTVRTAEMPEQWKNDPDLICSCIAGASSPDEIENMLREAGFTEISVKIKTASGEFVKEWAPGSGVENVISSAEIRAVKPEGTVEELF